MRSVPIGVVLVSLWSASAAMAAERCGIPTALGLGCEVGIHTANFQSVQKQLTNFTCWAASFSNLLRYSGIQLLEPQIVKQTTHTIRTADGTILNSMLNRSWIDDAGQAFTVSARATDRMTGTVQQITNADVYQALKNGIPVYYTDQNHAMVVLQIVFGPGPSGPVPVAGIVADPNPSAPDFRQLDPQEMIGMYAAIVLVRKP